ncbi:extracellular solute-binding protein [Streptomyces niveiscabiei]|uniref:extracellular solute-binding protein n=1 Tax=Streptomyces niveiscabiei TaxID=164115 RepID=UPI0029A70A91|nr:extracellular solute-binding protein [Streptomyces niveiscabiei]MDX3384026.1 extracellular solute-binding protein [Streptomyces niveiscabiei]
MGRPDLNRRQLLAAAGGLVVAGSFGFAALGSGADALASGSRPRVRYWNLFQGGDGGNMVAMVDAFRKADPGVDVKDSTLSWGGPYYTKLAMAAAGNRAPDLGIMHQGRVPGFAPGRLLDPWDMNLLTKYGVKDADFNPVLWQRGLVGGELYALPLDIHAQLNFYRKDVCRKAGLLDANDRLPEATSVDAWFDVLKAARKQLKPGVQTLGLHANDQNFSWWFFVAFYQQLGGSYFDDARTDTVFDTEKATEVLEFLRKHVTDGYVTVGASDGEAFIAGSPFAWEGNWSVPYYGSAKVEFGAQPLPPVFGRPATHVESHSFVLPHQSDRGGAANDGAHRLAAYLVKHATAWAGGGHVPAYLPTFRDPEYLKLSPQNEYSRPAMDHPATEPHIWFAGSTGVLANKVGPIIAASNLGSTKPAAAARRMKSALEKLLESKNPMDGLTAAQEAKGEGA